MAMTVKTGCIKRRLLYDHVFYAFYVPFVIFILVGNNEIVKKGIFITNGIFSRRGQFLREFD